SILCVYSYASQPFTCIHLSSLFYFSSLPPPPRSTLFPYTTLFRSALPRPAGGCSHARSSRSTPPPCGPPRTLPPAPPRASSDCIDRKSTRLNSSHGSISYAVFCLKKKKNKN